MREREADRAVVAWLAGTCGLVVLLIAVGGLTRLSGAGLSIVEWRPVTGVVPPLDPAAWQAEFARYQGSPQFRLENPGMTLEGFQRIYLWEYAHRLLGRAAGLAVLLPGLALAWRRRLPRWLVLRAAGALALGGLQGGLGWLMVKSGLADQPRVSPLRLAAHLGLGLSLLAYLLWTLADVAWGRAGPARQAPIGLLRNLRLVLALLAAQVVLGALTAGQHAGLFHETFPTMDGAWVPPGLLALSPPWRNLWENPTTAQFAHRAVAWALLAAATALGLRAHRLGLAGRAGRAVAALAAGAWLQFALGVATLLHAVPPPLAAAHQLGACALLAAAVLARHQLPAARLQTRWPAGAQGESGGGLRA